MGLLDKIRRRGTVDVDETYDDFEDYSYDDEGYDTSDIYDDYDYEGDDGYDEDPYFNETDGFYGTEDAYRAEYLDAEADESVELYEQRMEERRVSKLEEEQQIQEYFKQGYTLEEIEAIEYRKAKRETVKAQAQKDAQDRIDFLDSFTSPKTIFGFILFYIVNVIYINVISGQIGFSILLGLFGAYILTKWFIFKESQLDQRQKDLEDLESLATDISFEAQSGKNVYTTFQALLDKDEYDGRVEADIKYTFDVLNTETELDVTNFESYNFTPFNLFLRNVGIWYTEGVPVREMFDKTISNINFDLVKRDELRERHKKKLWGELMTTVVSLAMPVVVRFAAPAQYELAMGQPIALALIVGVFYILQVLTISSMKKKSLDIDIR